MVPRGVHPGSSLVRTFLSEAVKGLLIICAEQVASGESKLQIDRDPIRKADQPEHGILDMSWAETI